MSVPSLVFMVGAPSVHLETFYELSDKLKQYASNTCCGMQKIQKELQNVEIIQAGDVVKEIWVSCNNYSLWILYITITA